MFQVQRLNSSTLTQPYNWFLFLTWDCWITRVIFGSHCTAAGSPVIYEHLRRGLSLGRYKNFTQTAIEMFEQEQNRTPPSPKNYQLFWRWRSLLPAFIVKCESFLFTLVSGECLLQPLWFVMKGPGSVYCYGVVCLNGRRGSCIKAESWNRGHAAIFQGQRGSLALTSSGCVINP